MEQWKDFALQMWAAGNTWSDIATELHYNFPSLDYARAREKVRSYVRSTDAYKAKHSGNKKAVGIIGDYHAPFNHPNYLQFCKDTFKKHNVGQIVCIGDLVDNHAVSRHPTEPNAYGPYDELDKALIEVAKVTKAFPRVKMCKGNHDEIVRRQTATINIGDRFLKSYHELWGLPKTWEISDEFIINDVIYRHGINCAGKDGAINAATQERMSLVMGHAHAFGGCKYSANKRDIIFGLNVGCGIDIDAYAFAYGKYAKNRPTLGCGIVYSSAEAYFVPMGAEYFRD